MKALILTSPEYLPFIRSLITEPEYIQIIWEDSSEYNIYSTSVYDVGISFMWTHKVPKEELMAHTWFNFHPAPLPEYKGRNLCYHAIMNGEKEFGATFHYMDEDFDTGDIIEVQDFEIAPWWNAEDLSGFTMIACENLFYKYFPRIITGEKFPRIKNKGGHYYKKEPIVDEYDVSNMPVGDWIRAVTYKDFYPKLNIHGVTYKVVKE